MSFLAPKITTVGRQAYAATLGTGKLTFTAIQMGDGNLVGSIADKTGLSNAVVTIPIDKLTCIGTTATVKGTFRNTDQASGFYWREVGLFVADPSRPDDRSKDILFCYQHAGELAEYIPSASSEQVEKIIAISAVVGDADSVTAVISSEAYVHASDYQTKVSEIELAVADNASGLAAHTADQENPHGVSCAQIHAHHIGIDHTPIEANQDLNEIVRTGTYKCQSDAIAETLYNCPTKKAFVLTMYAANGSSLELDTTGEAYTYMIQDIVTIGAEHFCRTATSKGSNGATFGEWKSLLATDTVKDYVIETGSDGNWEWHKWSSGILECWRRAVKNDVSITKAWGSLYESTISFTFSYPRTFVSQPMLNVSATAKQKGVLSIEQRGAGTTTQTPALYVVRATTDTFTEMYFNLHAIGRWKK